MEGVGCLLCAWVVTLVIHADVAGVEADVVLVFVALVLCHGEQRGVLNLEPELPVFVFQQSLVLSLESQKNKLN